MTTLQPLAVLNVPRNGAQKQLESLKKGIEEEAAQVATWERRVFRWDCERRIRIDEDESVQWNKEVGGGWNDADATRGTSLLFEIAQGPPPKCFRKQSSNAPVHLK